MAKLIALVLACALLAGCAEPKTICGVTYDSYGLLNSDDKKNPDIQYKAGGRQPGVGHHSDGDNRHANLLLWLLHL